MPPGTKSVTCSSAATDAIQDVARALSAEPVRAISEIRRGGNSRIFRVETGTERYALKKYPAADNRNRLEAEVNALRFMERKGIGRTPKVVAVSPEQRAEALRIAHVLRERGSSVAYTLKEQGVTKQLKVAGREGAREVLIVGPDELARGCVVAKNMESGGEREIALSELTQEVD